MTKFVEHVILEAEEDRIYVVIICPTPRPKPLKKVGVTLLEVVIAMVIFSFFMAIFFRVMERVVGRTSQQLSNRLILQMEARRALLGIYHHLQQGIEILSPQPGSTLPYLMYRDIEHNICCLYLTPDATKTKEEKRPMYRVHHLKRDPAKGTAESPSQVLDRVVRLNFTAHSPSGLFLSLSLANENREYSLVNFVRFKNSLATD